LFRTHANPFEALYENAESTFNLQHSVEPKSTFQKDLDLLFVFLHIHRRQVSVQTCSEYHNILIGKTK